MSTIVAPYPPVWYDNEHQPAPQARWWRLALRPNKDNNLLIMRTDAKGDDIKDATWVSWEFFDGCDTMIDAGLDKPSVEEVRVTHREGDYGDPWGFERSVCLRPPTAVLDILSVEAPTPSPQWCPMTMPGEHIHPEDAFSDRICTPTRRACRRY